MNFLGQLHHPNLVKLIGYCSEDDQRLLVYEFMPRGSLENHLFRSEIAHLSTRLVTFHKVLVAIRFLGLLLNHLNYIFNLNNFLSSHKCNVLCFWRSRR